MDRARNSATTRGEHAAPTLPYMGGNVLWGGRADSLTAGAMAREVFWRAHFPQQDDGDCDGNIYLELQSDLGSGRSSTFK